MSIAAAAAPRVRSVRTIPPVARPRITAPARPRTGDDRASLTDEQLLARVAHGDEEAFARLHDRLAPLVLGVCRRVLRDHALAEETAQEVLLEVWTKAAQFDAARGRATTWALTIAHRRAVDRVRSEQAARMRVSKVAARSCEREFDEVSTAAQTRAEHRRVREAVAGLSERQREAIGLAYGHGRTYREVALLLGIPEGTAKSRLRDGLAELRRRLEGDVEP